MNDMSDLLAQNPMFSSLPPQHREKLVPHMTEHPYQANATIVQQGDPGDALYIVKSGSVGVFRRDPGLGIIQMVTTIEPPEAFGEMSLVTGETRTATCTALEATIVARLSREVFLAVVQQAPNVAMAVARSLAERLGRMTAEYDIPWTPLTGRTLDSKLWSMAPESLWVQGRMAPLQLNGRTLNVGVVDPADAGVINSLRQAIPGVRLKISAITEEDHKRFIQSVARGPAKSVTEVTVPKGKFADITFMDDEEVRVSRGVSMPSMTGPQVIETVSEIIGTALASDASDIHIEHDLNGVTVRYRIEGILKKHPQPISVDMAKPLTSRIKLLAKLDITETRRPQDGRISVQVGGRMVDLRISTMPSKFGEKVVMRILDAQKNLVDIKTIIVHQKVRQIFTEMIYRPNGLVLVTGPTGSGKTTTMYAGLMARRRPELNLVTVEDPIEYHLDGTTQIQVHPEVGTTFHRVLRSLLRQDPDVILVGETRDAETARMAVEASMTGHLVITSMHANGALESVLRLLELDVERFALANTLLGVLHQRLVRRCCPDCTEPFEFPEPIVERLYRVGAFLPHEKPVLSRGKGCVRCNNTGFKGRVALLELLIANDAVKAAISANADMKTLKEVARQGALVDMARYSGILVGTGLTTPGEVLHMLQQVGT